MQKKILELTEKYPVIETFMESNQSISLTEEEHKAVHRYFQLKSEKEMIEEEYHFYMGQAQMISYGAMLGKIKKAILGKDDGDTQKLLELLLDTWIDEVEEQLKENIAYQGMLEKISKYEEQVQTMGLAKEKRKTIDAYVTEVSERWILYAESLYAPYLLGNEHHALFRHLPQHLGEQRRLARAVPADQAYAVGVAHV